MHRSTSWLFAAGILVAAGCTGTASTPPGNAAGGTPGTNGSGGATTGPSGSGGSTTAGSGGATGSGSGGSSSSAGGSGGATGTGGSTTTGAGGASAPDGGTAPLPFKGVANSACNDLTTLKTSWWYNWTTTPSNCNAPGSAFVPMIAGKSEKTPDAVTSALTKIAAAGYKTVLGFNEPNKTDQANLTVDQVIGMWPQLTANAAIRVGSPATSADAPGQTWFTSFMSEATAMNFRPKWPMSA